MIVTLYWCAALQPRGFKPGTIDSGAASPASQYSALVLAPRSSNPNLTTSYRCSAAPEQQSAQQLSSSTAQHRSVLAHQQPSDISSSGEPGPDLSSLAVWTAGLRVRYHSTTHKKTCWASQISTAVLCWVGRLCLEINVLTYSKLS